MGISAWKVLERSVYTHSPWRRLVDVKFELPSGSVKTFSLKYEGRVVSILALSRDKMVILARQYRPGPDQVLDELPAGGVAQDETPLNAARRELLEETGYSASSITPLGRPLECAYSTVERHAFLALDCVRTGAQQLDDSEFIEVIEKPIADFVAQLQAGLCTDPEVGWMGLFHLGYLRLADTP